MDEQINPQKKEEAKEEAEDSSQIAPPVGKPLFKIGIALGIVAALVIAGFVGYKLLNNGEPNKQVAQPTEQSTSQLREKGEVYVSFVPPAETVVWDSSLDDQQQWPWSPPIKVTIENKTATDLVIPTFGDFYVDHPEASSEAHSAADELEAEMTTRVNRGDGKHNTNLRFRYTKEGSVYGFGRKGDHAEWTIPAGQTATENIYLDANSLASTCPGFAWNKVCTLKDVQVELSFGEGLYSKTELINLEESTGHILSEPQDIVTTMR